MSQIFYRRLWPLVFLALGVMAASDVHFHIDLFGLLINLHNLMWFLMAAAHAHVYFPNREAPDETVKSGAVE